GELSGRVFEVRGSGGGAAPCTGYRAATHDGRVGKPELSSAALATNRPRMDGGRLVYAGSRIRRGRFARRRAIWRKDRSVSCHPRWRSTAIVAATVEPVPVDCRESPRAGQSAGNQLARRKTIPRSRWLVATGHGRRRL